MRIFNYGNILTALFSVQLEHTHISHMWGERHADRNRQIDTSTIKSNKKHTASVIFKLQF